MTIPDECFRDQVFHPFSQVFSQIKAATAADIPFHTIRIEHFKDSRPSIAFVLFKQCDKRLALMSVLVTTRPKLQSKSSEPLSNGRRASSAGCEGGLLGTFLKQHHPVV